ncbi:MAG TPA: glutathione S-transferase family protein [Pseudoxanthomonas sp.]|nr:glutathione S-transferase family protein [Pseudoxanthomonas sp.]
MSATPRYRLIGNHLSPYVRKVLLFLELKGLDYEIDPIAPFVGDERFAALSPLRRVPVLLDGGRVVNDSSVICQYLEECHPAPALYPADVGERAQARWLEEFCDARLGEVVVWKMFYQRGVKRVLFGEATDEAVFARARDVELPGALDWLETQLPADGWACGTLSIADLTIASFLRNAAFVRWQPDPARWPRLSVLLERAWALPAFARLAALEDAILRTPIPEQRQVLAALGAPLSRETLGTWPPRKGVMRIE